MASGTGNTGGGAGGRRKRKRKCFEEASSSLVEGDRSVSEQEWSADEKEFFEILCSRVRRHALIAAAGDVCPYCGGRASGDKLTGPNESGNFVHGMFVCRASAIWARIAAEEVD